MTEPNQGGVVRGGEDPVSVAADEAFADFDGDWVEIGKGFALFKGGPK